MAVATLVALRPLGLGDLLTGVPAIRALARAFPEHRRILAAPAALAPLALHAGGIDAVHHTVPGAALDAALGQADVAVDLHGKGPESHRVLLAARPRRLIAFANTAVGESSAGPEWRFDEHEVARWCRMLTKSGVPADPVDLDLDPPPVPVPASLSGATLIHPGAASEARRWPAERFAEVARVESESGRRVVVTGSRQEVALAAHVAELGGLPRSAVLAGRTDLLTLAALVATAGRVVCGDTGVGHLATALRTASVVLFGPVSPAHWGPPPDRPWHRVLWAGRTGNPHSDRPDRGLLDIGVEDVLEALAELGPPSDGNPKVAAWSRSRSLAASLHRSASPSKSSRSARALRS
ncbi:MAG TPA: glycosyltransferase family 9 protein [Gaiellaceae bacterium]|nr:glycosyltransferase family 9 protein [Gaiellaceae bacterium]